MLVHRCDNCKKFIKEGRKDSLGIGWSLYPEVELCKSCAGPVIDALEKQQILPKKLLKTLQPDTP